MKSKIYVIVALLVVIVAGCASSKPQPPVETEKSDMTNEISQQATNNPTVSKMKVQVGDSVYTATLEQNAAVHELIEMLQKAPITIKMQEYSGFEKVGSLQTTLTTSDNQTTTHPGDIVLYNGNQMVIFYGSNSWSYTRLGKIDDLAGWEEILGNGDVQVTFSIES